MKNKLTFLYDGQCPLCLREVNFLKKKDKSKFIKFVDISNSDYSSIKFGNISYEDAMSNLHGILSNGNVIKGLDVLILSYELIDMSWLYAPAKIPYISVIIRAFYRFWARNRLKITGRGNTLKSCNSDFSKVN